MEVGQGSGTFEAPWFNIFQVSSRQNVSSCDHKWYSAELPDCVITDHQVRGVEAENDFIPLLISDTLAEDALKSGADTKRTSSCFDRCWHFVWTGWFHLSRSGEHEDSQVSRSGEQEDSLNDKDDTKIKMASLFDPFLYFVSFWNSLNFWILTCCQTRAKTDAFDSMAAVRWCFERQITTYWTVSQDSLRPSTCIFPQLWPKTTPTYDNPHSS